MKVIKFRAWDFSAKQMLPVGKLEFFDDNSMHINDEHPCCFVMQYTGLRDNDGKEVYEGDIIKYGNIKYEICWYKGGFHFKNVYGAMDSFIRGDFIEVQVIGNIYENKELLNEQS